MLGLGLGFPNPNPNPNPNQEEAEEQQRAACAASRLAALEESRGLEQQRASLRAQASPSYHPQQRRAILQSEVHRLCLNPTTAMVTLSTLLWQASAVQSELRGISEAEV